MTMTTKQNLRFARGLLAVGLATGLATAYAATGVNITTKQENMITAGMTTQQVQSAIGRPEHVARYVNEQGPTWTYGVQGAVGLGGGEAAVFDVDFGADGRVVTVEEIRLDNGGGG
jgi:outer membrane protein assembly factor BamE (lipoprotein component of BamABCDE complex)